MMTAQRLNFAVSSLAGANGNFVGDWLLLLNTITRLGYEVAETSETKKGWSATISRGGLASTGYGESLNHAACMGLLKLHSIVIDNQARMDRGELQFRENNAPLAVAQLWLSEGCKVSREAWGGNVYLSLNRGCTRAELSGPDMYGVPAKYFDCDPMASVTVMPRFVLTDIVHLTTADWTPAAADLLASDWRLV